MAADVLVLPTVRWTSPGYLPGKGRRRQVRANRNAGFANRLNMANWFEVPMRLRDGNPGLVGARLRPLQLRLQGAAGPTALDRQFDQARNKRLRRNAGRLPHLWVHRDGRETGDRIHFIQVEGVSGAD